MVSSDQNFDGKIWHSRIGSASGRFLKWGERQDNTTKKHGDGDKF
jgi:hypothetical protein